MPRVKAYIRHDPRTGKKVRVRPHMRVLRMHTHRASSRAMEGFVVKRKYSIEIRTTAPSGSHMPQYTMPTRKRIAFSKRRDAARIVKGYNSYSSRGKKKR